MRLRGARGPLSDLTRGPCGLIGAFDYTLNLYAGCSLYYVAAFVRDQGAEGLGPGWSLRRPSGRAPGHAGMPLRPLASQVGPGYTMPAGFSGTGCTCHPLRDMLLCLVRFQAAFLAMSPDSLAL